MAQRCRVCARPDRAEIEAYLRGAHNLALLGRKFGLSRQALGRHRENHVVEGGPVFFLEVDGRLRPIQDSPAARAAPLSPPQPPEETFPEEAFPTLGETPSPSVKKLPPQEAFLTHFSASADLKGSLKEAGIGRVVLRQWQEHDESFALRFHQAEAEAVENLEAEARIRAVAGSKMIRRVYRHGMLYEEIHEFRPSDAMLVKLLQAAKPEKYGERLTLTQTTVVKAIAEDAWAAV